MTDSSKQPVFEESLRRLEEIVSLLDGGKADLETSLAYYEEGVKLLRQCRTTLSDAEQRIEILKKGDVSGELVTEVVNPASFRSDESTPGRQTEASVTSASRTVGAEKKSTETADVKPKRTRNVGTGKSRVAKLTEAEDSSAGKNATSDEKETDPVSATLSDVSSADVSKSDVSGPDVLNPEVSRETPDVLREPEENRASLFNFEEDNR